MADADVVMGDVRLLVGDCRERLREVSDGSVDAIIADPPYPEISRSYGRMTEAEWHEMMRGVVAEARRILKPSGSSLFILQPNGEHVGEMRPWFWEFVAWSIRHWNMVQDAYWWNFTALPTGGACTGGLLRSSVKACVWLGPADCYRDQGSVLWEESQGNIACRAAGRVERFVSPSSARAGGKPREKNSETLYAAAARRGGVTPFNLLPIPGSDRWNGGGTVGHPASTPEGLCDWWVRYLSPEGGTVCDPFMGSGTTGLAALKRGRSFIGIERDPGYFTTATHRLRREADKHLLLTGA